MAKANPQINELVGSLNKDLRPTSHKVSEFVVNSVTTNLIIEILWQINRR